MFKCHIGSVETMARIYRLNGEPKHGRKEERDAMLVGIHRVCLANPFVLL